jgi:hypothetical protein
MMSFIVYKKFGKQEYAYELESYRDPETKKPKHRQKYLGVVVDKANKIYERRREISMNLERQILDYGDSYMLSEITQSFSVIDVFKKVFGDWFDTLMTLIFHRIIDGGAMCHVKNWYDANYVNQLFSSAKVTSQDISKFLSYLGEESVQRAFFAAYIPLICKGKTGILIDSTGLPNEINMDVTGWGHHNGEIEKETRLILAVEKGSEQPLYFRYVSGNIGDVSTLANTIDEMKRNGISTAHTIVDAGYYSENNLKLLFEADISFLIRMPSNRVAYKNIITQNADIESLKYAVKYDKRGLFVKENKIIVCEKTAYAYLVLDPERRGREISKTVSEMNENVSDKKDMDLSNCGKFVLLSNEKIDPNKIIPLYYTRQIAEKMFAIAKNDLNILPLRTHSEPNFKGFMMLIFLSLILYCYVKTRLGNRFSIEKALSIMKPLKCKVYQDSIVPNEVNKKQRLLFEILKIVVPKIPGI